jgi:hypothetical protein
VNGTYSTDVGTKNACKILLPRLGCGWESNIEIRLREINSYIVWSIVGILNCDDDDDDTNDKGKVVLVLFLN